ncbi:MAG TPA: LysR family transcriptional regulator [Blastocatellia bacterium]
MDLYQLRTFLIVAEEKTITRAAKRLFTTPPSISAHIRTLEDERLGRGLTIRAGRKLLVS